MSLLSLQSNLWPLTCPSPPQLFSELVEERTRELIMDRIVMLSEILTANPADSFARYGLAMEYSKAGQIEQALQEFKTLIEKNPDYTPAYFMAAQTLATASRVDEAKRWLMEGISSAVRTGNAHAQSEMTAMLEELGEAR
jgi:tetratricopeptide (TPR) repeat protein